MNLFGFIIDRDNPKEGIMDLMLLSILIGGSIFMIYLASFPANIAILLFNISLEQAFYINFSLFLILEILYMKFVIKRFYSLKNT